MKRSRRENPADLPPTPPGGLRGQVQGQIPAAGGAKGGFEFRIGKRVEGLIRDPGDDDFEVREKASATLLRMADVAEPLLKAALEKTASAQVEMRPERILEAIDTPGTREAVARQVQPSVSRAIRRAAGDAVRRQKP